MNPTAITIGSMVEVMSQNVIQRPNKMAFRYLINNQVTDSYTYGELNEKAKQVAHELQEYGIKKGDRALLIYPPGLDFVAGFLGCLYAGVIAVPTVPPNKHMARFQRIISDCTPSIVLSTAKLSRLMRQKGNIGIDNIPWLMTDDFVPRNSQDLCLPDPDDIAFIQYSSGTTISPKGVLVTHRNLIYNSALMQEANQSDANLIMINWLPLFHDLGLIGTVLQSIFVGGSCVTMSPNEFLNKPVNWLMAITKYRGSYSGGPDFAYALCSKKVTEQEKRVLDLSSWTVAINGSDTICNSTMLEFSEQFAACGFSIESFSPSYGLSEATLVVSGHPGWQKGKVIDTNKERVAGFESYPCCGDLDFLRVSCGRPCHGLQVCIVDPETMRECGDLKVGEIWVKGTSVAIGHWMNEASTKATFHAYTADDHGPFLRTGDLGFMKNNELYFAGRKEDVLHIQGKILYPQDVELVIERVHSAIVENACAAFTVKQAEEINLVIVVELRNKVLVDREWLEKEIKKEVDQKLDVSINHLDFIQEGSISKTSSGKVQRYLCKQKYLKTTQAISHKTDRSNGYSVR